MKEWNTTIDSNCLINASKDVEIDGLEIFKKVKWQ